MNRRGLLKLLGIGAAAPVVAVAAAAMPKQMPNLADDEKAALEKYHGASIGVLSIGDGAHLSNMVITATDTGIIIQAKESGGTVGLGGPLTVG
jgi:hypothetical protein